MDIITTIEPFIIPIIMGTCFILGEIIKPMNFVDSKFIPAIMAVVGVFMGVWLNGFAITPEIFFGGLASGWASTGAWETIKNLFIKE